MDRPLPLVLVASLDLSPEELDVVRRHSEAGARIVAWQHPIGGQDRLPSPDVGKYLQDSGIAARTLAGALGERIGTEIDEALLGFFKGMGRHRLGEAGPLRQAFRFRERSLWWWVELWLYYDTELRLHVRDVEALARLVELESPERLVVVAPVGELARIARALVGDTEIVGASRRRPRRAPHPVGSFLVELLKMLGTGVKSSLAGAPRPAEGEGRRVLCFTHASMWRRRRDPETGSEEVVEIYFDRLIPRLAADGNVVRVVGVGPRVPFKRRNLAARLGERLSLGGRDGQPYVPAATYLTLRHAIEAARGYLTAWREWRRMQRMPGLDEALEHRGVDLSREGRDALREAFLRLVPSAMRSFVEVRAMLELERADVIALYAESTALGRATVAAAASLGVPSFAIQHGIMYPFYYSHEHAADEVGEPYDGTTGVPIPTLTAVFGRHAEKLLRERGHYPASRIVVTGSPKFDGLLEATRSLRPDRIRARLGIEEGGRMLLVASRFSSIGPVFRDLVRAAESRPEVHLLVKPHQAESPGPYLEVARTEGAARVRVLSPAEDLLELVVASDALVTVDSFASSEALVLGRPVMIVNLPNNLQMFVEAELAVGARRGEDMCEPLERILDPGWVEAFEKRLEAKRDGFAYGADGGSTERILGALYRTAKR